MREIELKSGHRLELYDSVDEMPMVRYHKFTQYLVLGCGLGKDAEELATRVAGIRRLVADGETGKADVELLNMQQALQFAMDCVDPRGLAFAALVRTLDGEEQTDVTSDGLQRLSERLEKIVLKRERDSANAAVKKKTDEELKFYFPRTGEESIEECLLLRRLTLLILEEVAKGVDKEAEKAAVKKKMSQIQTVRLYADFEREDEVLFEQGCLGVTETLHKDAKSMNVLEYMSAVAMLEERAKEMKKITRKGNI